MNLDERIASAAALVIGLSLATENGRERPLTQQELSEVLWALHYAETRIRTLDRYVERLALCPDHRDKASGRCVVCQAEERTRDEWRRR